MLSNPTFWTFVGLVIFLGVVWKAGAFATAVKALDDKGRAVADELAQAQRLRDQAAALLAEFEGKREAAEREAQSIVAAAQEEAERLAKEAEEKLADFVARRTKSAEDKIAQAERDATRAVRAAAADVAIAAAESILRERTKGEDGARMLRESLDEVAARLN